MMNLKKKIVVGVASAALIASMGVTPAFADQGVNTHDTGNKVVFPDGGSFTRLSGDSRFDTAMAVAEQTYKDSGKKLKVAYLVSSSDDSMVDAATSGMLKDGVVLLVSDNKAQQLLLGASIKEKFPTVSKLVAVGGTAVVSDDAIANVKKMDSKVTTTDRLGGKDRYETNVAVAKAVFKKGDGINRVYFTRGDLIVDALTAGAVANGPVLLVRPTGDVSEATKDYYQGLPTTRMSDVIIGGDKALSDEQVGKIMKEVKRTDAWSFLKSTAELQENIKSAAANYYGQSEWQNMGALDSSHRVPLPYEWAKFKESDMDTYNFLGLAAGKAPSDSKNPADINTGAAVNKKGKVFVGYKAPHELLSGNLLVVKNYWETLNTTTQNALRVAMAQPAGQRVTAASLQVRPGNGTPAGQLWAAIQAQYGLSDAKIKTTITDDAITEEGAFAFDDDGNLKGLNTGLFDDIQGKLAGGDWNDEKVFTIDKTAKSLSDTIYSTINNPGNVTGQKTSKADVFAGANWDALYKVLAKEQEKQAKATADAKEALISAVKAFYDKKDVKITTTKGGSIPRLSGKNRYETSALLAVFMLNYGGSDGWVNAAKVDPKFGRAYLASGDDEHLIDSVVAGQLTDGPILLAPATGDLNEYVVQHLAYLKNKVSNLGTYLIGGKASVSDETRDKAINALRNSKTFAGSWNWVNSGDQKDPNAPLVADSEKVEVTAGADKAVEIKLKASGKVDATAELVGAAPAGYLVEVKEGVVYIKVTAEATDAKLTFKNAADKITSIYVTVKKAPEQPNKDNSEKDNGKQDGGKQTPPADK